MLNSLLKPMNNFLQYIGDHGDFTQHDLSKYQAHTIKICLQQPDHTLFFIVSEQNLCLLSKSPDNIDLSITMLAKDLLNFAHTKQGHIPMTIKGNTDLAIACKKYLSTVQIDWQALLIQQLGPTAGALSYQISSKIHSSFAIINDFLCQSTKHYIHHDTYITPNENEVTQFCQDVEYLLQRTDHLESTINLLDNNS